MEHFPSLSSSPAPPPPVARVVPRKAAPKPQQPEVPQLEDVRSSATYIKAKDFAQRNTRLFDSIAKWLGKSTARTRHLEENRLDTFKKCSRHYRQGEIGAKEYYAKVSGS